MGRLTIAIVDRPAGLVLAQVTGADGSRLACGGADWMAADHPFMRGRLPEAWRPLPDRPAAVREAIRRVRASIGEAIRRRVRLARVVAAIRATPAGVCAVVDLTDAWPFPVATDAYQAGERAWFVISEDHAMQLLEAVPPIYHRSLPHGFMVGEAAEHAANGIAIHDAVVPMDGRWYLRTLPRVADVIADAVAGLGAALRSGLSVRRLRPAELREGLRITCIDHPDWGEFTIHEVTPGMGPRPIIDGGGWTKRGRSGSSMFFPGEAHFWAEVAP